MVKRKLIVVLATLMVGVITTVSALDGEKELPSIEPGRKLDVAANFRLADLHGVRMQLSEVEAPVVVLHFWSKYRDCKYDLELLQRLHEKYEARGVKIIGVVFSSGTRQELDEFVSELDVEFPNLMCTQKVRSAYDVSTFPTTFLLDSEKRIRYWMYGILVDKHWDQLVRELLEEHTQRQLQWHRQL